jgi:glucuronate isomerase
MPGVEAGADLVERVAVVEVERCGNAESLPRCPRHARLHRRTQHGELTRAAHLVESAARHPRLKFVCFLASRHANQSLCTLCQELPNFSLAGYWWHNFFPDIIRQVMAERLDMLPLNKQIGFFSDAYSIEWVYAKILLVRKVMAQVLGAKVALGQYTQDEAISIAKETLFETPQTVLGMSPRKA